MAMNAVSAGQWDRYQSGGGHTANSHSTTRAVAVPIPSRTRFTPGGSAGREGDAEGGGLLDRQRLADGRNGEGHVAGFGPGGLGEHAVGAEPARDVAGSGGLDLDRLAELAAAAGAGEADGALDPDPVVAGGAGRHDGVLLHVERHRAKGVAERIRPDGA